MRIRFPVLGVIAVLLLGSFAAAPVSQASHWCGETFALVTPTVVEAGLSQTFTLQLTNEGANVTTLTSVQILFEWETNPRTAAGRTLNPNVPQLFTFTPSPPPTGVQAITVTFVGTNDADPPGAAITCTVDLAVQSLPQGSLFSGLAAILLVVLVVVIVVVVLIVVIVVVLSRKKKAPPPMAPPMSPPPFQPPG